MLDTMFPCNIYLILAIVAVIFTQSLLQVRKAQLSFIHNNWTNFGRVISFIPLVGFSWYYINVMVVLVHAHSKFVNCVHYFDPKLFFILSINILHFIKIIRKLGYNAGLLISYFLGAYYKPALTSYSNTPELDFYSKAFFALLIFKFLKVIVHTISYLAYRPACAPQHRNLDYRDVTLIVPTVGDLGPESQESIRSILANNPRQIIVSVVGPVSRAFARTGCNRLDAQRCRVVENEILNKRGQLVTTVNAVQTSMTCFADNDVFWSTTFLESALIPLENPAVGRVGTTKHVRRNHGGSIQAQVLVPTMVLLLHQVVHQKNVAGSVFHPVIYHGHLVVSSPPVFIPAGSLSPIAPEMPTPSSPASLPCPVIPPFPAIGAVGGLPTLPKCKGPKVFCQGIRTIPRREALNVEYQKHF